MKRVFLRGIASIGCGVLLTAAYNGLSILFLSSFDPSGEGVVAEILFAPGFLFAGRGFEAQAVVIPINVVAFFFIFSAGTWFFLRRKARLRALKNGNTLVAAKGQ